MLGLSVRIIAPAACDLFAKTPYFWLKCCAIQPPSPPARHGRKPRLRIAPGLLFNLTHQHTKRVQVWPDRIKTFPPASPILSKKHSANPVRLRLSVFGVGVPTGTCVEIIESLNRKINAALADPACCHFPEAAVRLG